MNSNRRQGSLSDRSRAGSEEEIPKKERRTYLPTKDAESERTSDKLRNGGSINRHRVDVEKEHISITDPYVALRVPDTIHPDKTSPARVNDVSDTDPYVALRIADTPRARRSSEVRKDSDSYVSLRVAEIPRFRTGDVVAHTDPYVPLRVAPSQHIHSNREEGIYDSDDSSDTEGDDDYDSDGSMSEEVDEESSEFEEPGGSEDGDKGFAEYARSSVRGSETEQREADREFTEHAQFSAGSETGYGKDAMTEFPGYARVSVAGSEAEFRKNGDGEFPGYARVSVAGSEVDYGQDVYARLSVAGSEAETGRDVSRDFSSYARGSFSGREVDQGKDVYARVSMATNEAEYGNNTDRGFQYARVSVAGSEGGRERDYDRDASGYSRVPVLESKKEHATMASPGVQSLKDDIGLLLEEEEVPVSGQLYNEDNDSWIEEYEAYMELSPDRRAKLQYRVRVVLISPLFELKERKLSAFTDIYKAKFGEDVEVTGFRSAERLCRAMPHVVQRQRLEDSGELILVDSVKNRKAVSGIRSGLRRIVYDALNSFHKEITFCQLEEKCSELLGKSLVEVLSDHGYETPNVESLVKDLPDIASFVEAGVNSHVYLCAEAEDPALTDGLLIKSSARATNTLDTDDSELEEAQKTTKDTSITGRHFGLQPESLKVGSSLTLRSLRNELRKFESFSHEPTSLIEHAILQARLRMRILLAFHNSGRGVELRELPELYAKTFSRNLDLLELGFSSLGDLAGNWQDIFLLKEIKPEWVFLVPSEANRRILNTLRTGLRSSVYSALVETYPEGLDPLDFLQHLQQGMSGELWEVLDAAGYICSDAEKTGSILSKNSRFEFQLVDFEEICILLDDMIDFVRLGSNEDGSVVVKLRRKEVPLVDLLDCKMEEIDVGSFDELFVNLMMIAVDDTENSGVDDGSSENGRLTSVGHVQSLVKSFEGSVGLRSAHPQTLNSLRLKHEIRLILGCPDYSESGLAWNQLSNVYKDRTGQELGSKSKIKSLLRAMPDIVCKDSLVEEHARLSKTPKNLRVLSATRAGLRQVLFWALVKNPGGVWAHLLEGWFTDFTGMSLAATLQIHGYEMSKSRPFFPVYVFLKDMNDLLQKKSATYEIYTWAGEVKDPVHSDASLLGLSELMIQYNPVRKELSGMSHREAEVVEEFADESALREGQFDRKVQQVEDLMNKISLKESEDGRKAELSGDTVDETALNESKVDKVAEVEDLAARHALEEEEKREGEADSSHDITSEILLKEHEACMQIDLEDKLPLNVDDMLTLGDDDSRLLQDERAVGRETDDRNILGESREEDIGAEQTHADSGTEDGSLNGSTRDPVEDDGRYIAEFEHGKRREFHSERSESIEEAYAQLRVAGRGPKVNLDEWQFTDSDEEEEEEAEEEEEEEEDDEVSDDVGDDFQEEDESEVSETEVTRKAQDKPSMMTTYVAPKVKGTGKDTRAWVLPSKGIPWK